MVNKWEMIGKLKSSSWRQKVLNSLSEKEKTPKELIKETNISSSHIAEVLKELENLKVIKCLTPDLRKGKIYSITKLGKEILNQI